MREMKRMVEGVTGGQCGDCVAWLHSADGCSNRPELKCHQPCAEKRPADSLYKHWHFFPPVIECSLKKSTQWIPREFSNAPSQCVYSPMYFTMIEGVSCPWREWRGRGEFISDGQSWNQWTWFNSTPHFIWTLCSWYHSTPKTGIFVVISASKTLGWEASFFRPFESPAPVEKGTFAEIIALRDHLVELFSWKLLTFMSVDLHDNIFSTPAQQKKHLSTS